MTRQHAMAAMAAIVAMAVVGQRRKHLVRPTVRGEDAPMLRCDGCHVARCVNAATPVLCGAETAMLAVRWLTGRRGLRMQVLQCGAPADGVEWRG